jgi:hypothetical protein
MTAAAVGSQLPGLIFAFATGVQMLHHLLAVAAVILAVMDALHSPGLFRRQQRSRVN